MSAPPLWTPYGFDDWQHYYPATPFTRAAGDLDWTEHFLQCWSQRKQYQPLTTVIVLVPGLYSEWLPGCNRHAVRALRHHGYEVLQVPVRSSRGVIVQGRHIATTLQMRLRENQRFIALTHSKGGIDMLAALSHDARLRARCDGMALVQPPVGPSSIIDDMFGWGSGKRPNIKSKRDFISRKLLGSAWFANGTRDISSQRDPSIAALLASVPRDMNCLHAVSWSVERSSRFDAHHERLSSGRPGYAHDGQFYLEHQVLPEMPQVCLPHLDHGQPVLGGRGFDAGRFWLALVDLLYIRRPLRVPS